MKYIFCLIILALFACNAINQNRLEEVEETPLTIANMPSSTKFSKDSLYRINLFDFYNKPLRELFDNEVIRQYDYYNFPESHDGCIRYMELGYDNNFLEIYFSDLKRDSYCSNDTLNIKISDLLNEKILRVNFPRSQPIMQTNDNQKAKAFIMKLKAFDFSAYYESPINTLITALPKLERNPMILIWKTEGCLDYASLYYRFPNEEIVIDLDADSLMYTPHCLDLKIKHWNFNDYKKEILKEVKTQYRINNPVKN